MDNTTFVCSNCGAVHLLTEAFSMNGKYICEECLQAYTHVCESCGNRVWDADTVSDGNIVICRSCYESRYTHCCECDRLILSESAYYDDDEEPYCHNCWEQTMRPIHEYSYKPIPIFYGDGPRYLGVELEIDNGGKDHYAANHILNAANGNAEHLYIKSDGSLDCGMELVTHPMTLDYHMNFMPWDDILDEAKHLGYLSHKSQTCGLHIHISRKAFGDSELEQECTIARLLYFIEKFWPELLRFSRRTESQINHWAARYGMKLSPWEMMSCAKNSCAGRYMAVNLTNYTTVEIRIFRGTLKLNTLLATLQMVNAICDVAIFMSDEELQALSWHGFLARITEPELVQYLKERDLYKNEPVFAEEDD